MVLWSALPLARVEVELAKLGTTTKSLILDARDVPELAPVLGRAGMSFEEKLRVALVWFGDDGHPQPEQRSNWETVGRTPNRGRLPRLDGDETPAAPKGDPGRPSVTVTKEILLEIFKQSLERARSTEKRKQPSYARIAADHEVGRTWVTPIVKWVARHPGDALHAVALSEIPQRFSTIVRD